EIRLAAVDDIRRAFVRRAREPLAVLMKFQSPLRRFADSRSQSAARQRNVVPILLDVGAVALIRMDLEMRADVAPPGMMRPLHADDVRDRRPDLGREQSRVQRIPLALDE